MKYCLKKSGFALLMTLFLVLLVGVSLVSLARRSMIEAMVSQTDVEELQRRWAIKSCQSTLLGRVEKLLDSAERGEWKNDELPTSYANHPMAKAHVKCKLANLDYELILTDEQSKLNLNHLAKEMSRAELQLIVERLIAKFVDAGNHQFRLNLQMLPTGDNGPTKNGDLLKVGAYDQVFEKILPEYLAGNTQVSGLTDAITFWGDGKVNLRRAPTAVIEQMCQKALGKDVVRALIAARNQNPDRDLSVILNEIKDIDEEQKTIASDYLTDRSCCYGLWVIAVGENRSWHTLAVGVSKGRTINVDESGFKYQSIDKWYNFAW